MLEVAISIRLPNMFPLAWRPIDWMQVLYTFSTLEVEYFADKFENHLPSKGAALVDVDYLVNMHQHIRTTTCSLLSCGEKLEGLPMCAENIQAESASVSASSLRRGLDVQSEHEKLRYCLLSSLNLEEGGKKLRDCRTNMIQYYLAYLPSKDKNR